MLGCVSIYAQTAADWDGYWIGDLKSPNGEKLKVGFEIKHQPDNTWKATLDVPDQFIRQLTSVETVINGKNIKLDFKQFGAKYTGIYDLETHTIQGQWEQGIIVVLDLAKGERIGSNPRPQTPQPPFPYHSEEVAFANKKAKINLAGTLTYPKEGANFPAVVLITGSGSQDRDETMFEHRPFAVLADYLTRRGFAVLRYDDRGAGKSTGSFKGSNTEDFVGDASAAVDFLKKQANIDPKKIGLIGHSEGGIIAPKLAIQRKDIAFIVLLAGVGIPMEDIIIEQNKEILHSIGLQVDMIERVLVLTKKAFSIIREDKKAKLTFEQFFKKFETAFTDFSPEDKLMLGLTESNWKTQYEMINSAWFRYAITIDPATYLGKVKCPVLAINGDKDIQVEATTNLNRIAELLEKGKNDNFTCTIIPNANHLFQICNKCTLAEYGELTETFSPIALDVVGEWLDDYK